MTEHDITGDGADDVMEGGDLPPTLLAALADDSTWADVPTELEDAIVAAITAEAAATLPEATSDPAPAGAPPSNAGAEVIDLDRRRRWRNIGLSVAAAAVIAVAAGVLVTTVGGDTDQPELSLALEATDLAPEASADVGIDTTPLGTRIILDVRDLPPAPDGTYYEAWLRVDAEIGVSAGTFHLRGGDGEIELWAGVTIEDYPLFTITLQDEGGGAASSGRVVLRGLAER